LTEVAVHLNGNLVVVEWKDEASGAEDRTDVTA